VSAVGSAKGTAAAGLVCGPVGAEFVAAGVEVPGGCNASALARRSSDASGVSEELAECTAASVESAGLVTAGLAG
jgi:hypothetical protein